MPDDVMAGASRPAFRSFADYCEMFRDEDRARFILLLSHYRSGSHLFKDMLKTLDGISCEGEVFHRFDGVDIPRSFAEFRRTCPEVDQEIDDLEKVIRAFFGFLLDGMPRNARLVLDVKYVDAYRFGVPDQASVPMPRLLELLAEWQMPLLHLKRNSIFHLAVSHQVLLQTGEWAKTPEGNQVTDDRAHLEHRPEIVFLHPADVLQEARAAFALQRQFDSYLSGYSGPVIPAFYEDIAGLRAQRTLARVATALGIYLDPQGKLDVKLQRQGSAERVGNITEIFDYFQENAPELLTSDI